MAITITNRNYNNSDTSVFGTVGTRIFGGRMGTYNAATSTTFQVTLETAQHFDAVRLILANTSDTTSNYTGACAVSVVANTSDLNNSAGTWVSANINGINAFGTRLAPGSSSRISYTVTDWASISSLDRNDGGVNPILIARIYFIDGDSTLPVYGDGTDDFTNWATRTDGHLWCSRSQALNGITTPANFTSTTNISQNPIVGIQYLARGKVISVMGVGDSITEGREDTYLQQNFTQEACWDISDINGIAVEYSNCGWSGQIANQSGGFYQRAIDILESDIRPDIIVLPNGSPNDSATITSATINAHKALLFNVLSNCKTFNTIPIIWTWLPSNSSIDLPVGTKNYGATDSLRVSYNADTLTLNNKGYIVADTSTPFQGPINSNGQYPIKTGYCTDSIHPNATGNTVLKAIIKDAITKVI